jgi:rhamnose utilization protein RhaD (predicted bifunctional aldolase and dehydrogenase)
MYPAKELKELSNYSSKIGRNISLIQGPGGNSSLKYGNTLWVKASGMWLADAETRPIFCSLNCTKIQNAMDYDSSGQELEQVIQSASGNLRPSIETSLHAAVPHKVVIHVHAIDVIAWLVRRSGLQDAEKLLDGLNWRWVPYRRPGVPLTIAVRTVLDTNPDILLLANHGVLIGGDNVQQVRLRLEEVIRRLSITQRRVTPEVFQVDEIEIRRIGISLNMRVAKHPIIQVLANDPISFALLGAGVLYPDQAVFLGPKIKVITAGEDFGKWATTPDYLIVEKCGVLVANDVNPAIEEMLAGHAMLLLKLDTETDLIPLSDQDISALVDWDAEAYRQNLESRK